MASKPRCGHQGKPFSFLHDWSDNRAQSICAKRPVITRTGSNEPLPPTSEEPMAFLESGLGASRF